MAVQVAIWQAESRANMRNKKQLPRPVEPTLAVVRDDVCHFPFMEGGLTAALALQGVEW